MKETTTAVPRRQALNQHLVELGHKTHSDERRKHLEKDKKMKERKEALYDEDWE
jgi:hypothetical protein